jgi:hypothetical protein
VGDIKQIIVGSNIDASELKTKIKGMILPQPKIG